MQALVAGQSAASVAPLLATGCGAFSAWQGFVLGFAPRRCAERNEWTAPGSVMVTGTLHCKSSLCRAFRCQGRCILHT